MNIRLLEGSDEQSQVRQLVMETFASKFSRVNLSPEQLLELTQLIWQFPSHSSKNKQYVGEVEGDLAGTISLIRENTSDETAISFFKLARQFGWLTVFRLLLCFGVLGHKLTPGEVYIDHVVSHPSMRGRGVGTKLLKMAQQSLGEGERLTLYVARSNPEAQKLYARLGFRVVEKRRSFLKKLVIGETGWYFMEWQARE